MIDLHLHTHYSDGRLMDGDIAEIRSFCHRISITDHNTTLWYADHPQASSSPDILMGCEITIDRRPDILIYFPNLHSFSNELEHSLQRIRDNESHIIQKCYFELGFHDWEEDLPRVFDTENRIKSARVRDLAAILYQKRTNQIVSCDYFEHEDLMLARKQRRQHGVNELDLHIDEPYSIAKSFHGIPVLPHPIRTAMRWEATPKKACDSLLKLLDDFSSHDGHIIEYEFLSDDFIYRHGVYNEISKFRSIIRTFADTNNIFFTISSDAHSFDDILSYKKWYQKEICTSSIKERLFFD